MLANRLFKYSITTAIILLLAIAISACAMKGYQIDLKTYIPDHALSELKNKFVEMGFLPSGHESSWLGKPAIVERFKKNIIISEEGLFSRDRKVVLHADVIFYVAGESSDDSKPAEITIYEVYEGNSPKVKPYLVEAANSLESAIRLLLPEALINRSEGLTGVPFI